MSNKIKNPIFYYNDNKKYEIKAGGVMFYAYDYTDKILKFLMINYNNKYEDFGGKTSIADKCIFDTISREVEEESNNIFTKDDIYNHIIKKKPIYTKNSKYIIYFHKLDNHHDFKPDMFGDKEIYEDIPRTVEWIAYDTLKNAEFVKNKLNFRLKFKHFFKRIDKIYKQYNNKFNTKNNIAINT